MNTRPARTWTRRLLDTTLALCAVAALSVTGCGSDDMMMPQFAHSAEEESNGLRLVTSTSKATYAFGDLIEIQATATNVTNAPLTVNFHRGIRNRKYDNVVLNMKDKTDFSVGVRGQGEELSVILAPGQSLSYAFSWDQMHRTTRRPVDPGTYGVSLWLNLETDGALRFPMLFVRIGSE